ncbi:DNA cytosine methyltransferase [Candidatus Roizmanbacteria bacterium]|nr:DNA cytosine methyltransferase [Candidatus Roizmanbacteria bacterium]
MKKKRGWKFIDLFAGIGGFHIAFSNLGAVCVYVSEYEKYCRITYENYFKPRHPQLFKKPIHFGGDITKVTESLEKIKANIPKFDILTGGFPCQPFSQAGKKKGFLDEARGTLFYDIVKILDARRPKAYFIENVRGLMSHGGGSTIKEMERIIRKLGYSFHAYPVRASDYGLPTHRPRTYMIGFRNNADNHIKFEAPSKIPLKFNLSKLFAKKIDREIGYTLRLGGVSSGIDDRRNWDAYRMSDGTVHKITVQEAAEMMGFPADFTFPKEISKRQAMRQLGNSVAISAIQAYAAQLLEVINQVK